MPGVQHLVKEGIIQEQTNDKKIHLKCVSFAFASLSTIQQDGRGGGGVRVCEHHRVEVDPQLADIRVGGAEGVGAGVAVRAGGVGRDDGVGVVGCEKAFKSQEN